MSKRSKSLFSPPRGATRALLALLGVVLFGSLGFMGVEGWDFWKSLFFTLITVTTVGYSDYGLSPAGERVASVLLLGGIAVATYAFGQLVQAVVNFRETKRRAMNNRIMKMSDHWIICGLGRIGKAVCIHLAQRNIPFVVIDHDEKTIDDAIECGFIAVAGDATEDDVLDDLGVTRAKGVACLTNSDPENIVITLSARELCPDVLIISRAEHEHSIRKIKRAGANRVISPVLSGGRQIAAAITDPHLAEMLESSAVAEGLVELSEIEVREGSTLAGQSIKELGGSHDSLVFVAIKDEAGAIRLRPHGDETLTVGDVIIIAGDRPTIVRAREDAYGPERLAA